MTQLNPSQYQTETAKMVEYANAETAVTGWQGAFEDGLNYTAIVRRGSMTILFKTERGEFETSLLESRYIYSHAGGLVAFSELG